MTITDLIQLMQNKLNSLAGLRQTAYSAGDINQVASLDMQIAETQQTLDQLRTLE